MSKASRRLAKRQGQQKQVQAKRQQEQLRQTVKQHFEAEEYPDTINTLAELVQAGGHDAESLYMGAYSYFMTGDYVRAAQMVDTILQLAPQHVAARILLARVCILEDRTDDGLAIFDFVLEHDEKVLTEQQREDVEDILEYYGRNEREHIVSDFPHVAQFLGLQAEAQETASEPAEQAAVTPQAAMTVSIPATGQGTQIPVQGAEAAPAAVAEQLVPEEAASAAPSITPQPPTETEAAAAPAAPAPEEVPTDAEVQDKLAEIMGQPISLREKVRVLNAFAGGLFVDGSYAAAGACLRQALQIDGQDTMTLRNLAVLLHAQGEQDKALAVAAQLPGTDFLLLDHLRRPAGE